MSLRPLTSAGSSPTSVPLDAPADFEAASTFQRAWIDAVLASSSSTLLTEASAEESTAGLVGRCFTMAKVDGLAAMYFPPSVMETIGRNLMLMGESVWEVNEALRWIPHYDIDERTGNYRLDEGRYRSKETVLHVRYTTDHMTGRGMGPLDGANRTREALRRLEMALTFELRTPVATMLSVPFQNLRDEDGNIDPAKGAAKLNKDVTEAKGGLTMVPSTQSTVPQSGKEYERIKVGPDMAETELKGWELATRQAMVAMGFPASFGNRGLTREDWRLFISTTLKPLGRLLEEAALVCNMRINISWNQLQATDLATRARAIKSFVDAGFTKEEAAAICDIELPGIA